MTITNHPTPLNPTTLNNRGGAAIQDGIVAVYINTKLNTNQAVYGAQKCLSIAGASFVTARIADFCGAHKVSTIASVVGTLSTAAGLGFGAKAVQLYTEDHQKLMEENQELKRSLNAFSRRALENRQPPSETGSTQAPPSPPSSRRGR